MANHSSPNVSSSHKPIGAYLVEAGILSEAQVNMALAEQKNICNMSFGKILVNRGWVKEQTIEYLMQRVIIPERLAQKSSFSDLELNLTHQKRKSPYVPTGLPEKKLPQSSAVKTRSSEYGVAMRDWK